MIDHATAVQFYMIDNDMREVRNRMGRIRQMLDGNLMAEAFVLFHYGPRFTSVAPPERRAKLEAEYERLTTVLAEMKVRRDAVLERKTA